MSRHPLITHADGALCARFDEAARKRGYRLLEDAPLRDRAGIALPILRGYKGERAIQLATRREAAEWLRTRAVATFPPKLQRPGDWQLAPAPGGVAGLLRVFEATSSEVVVVEEGARTEAAGLAASGTALPQSTVSFSKASSPARRFGAYMDADKDVLADAGVAQEVVETLLEFDVRRALDAQVVAGDGSGTGDAQQFDGLAVSASVPEVAVGATSRTKAILTAASQVRDADHVGRLVLVANPADALDWSDEAENRSVAERLAVFGVEPVPVLSSVMPAGTALLADWQQAATLYPRSGIDLALRQDDADKFVKGIFTVAVEMRVSMKLRHASAIRRLTGF